MSKPATFLPAMRGILLLICLLPGALTQAAGSSSATELHRLLQPINTFKASFTQQVFDEKGFEIQSFKGDIQVKKPGRVRWQAHQPVVQTVVTDNQKLYFYDADLEQLTIQPYTGDISKTPALLLSGEVDKLEASFSIARAAAAKGEQAPKAAKGTAVEQVYELRPKNKEALFELLTVRFVEGAIVSLDMLDSLRQRTVISFQDAALNEPIDDSHFVFHAPEGTDILIND